MRIWVSKKGTISDTSVYDTEILEIIDFWYEDDMDGIRVAKNYHPKKLVSGICMTIAGKTSRIPDRIVRIPNVSIDDFVKISDSLLRNGYADLRNYGFCSIG